MRKELERNQNLALYQNRRWNFRRISWIALKLLFYRL
nr:MAG TPA_asm: hypothetical protein [Caudoviricetes sp.]